MESIDVNPRYSTNEIPGKCIFAFCGGLSSEARTLTDILENRGFEVVSVRCKVGATPKERIGLRPEEKIKGFETASIF